MFGWCSSGQHDICRRKVRRFLIDGKKNTVTWLDEYSVCQCKKRGCACHVPAKDRKKPAAKRKRKA